MTSETPGTVRATLPGAARYCAGDVRPRCGPARRRRQLHVPAHRERVAQRGVRGFQNVSAALASLSDGEAARTVDRLRDTLAAHYSDERGLIFDSRSWLITARRRP